MVQDSSVAIFVPLLVLVVVEISQAAREFDLVDIATTKQEPFYYSVFYLLDRSSQELVRIPQLGPFNFIHGMNLGILMLGYALVVTTSGGSTRLLVCLILWLFSVLFPLLEVDEYVAIMDTPEAGPRSFLYHSIVTTLTAAALFFVGRTVSASPMNGELSPSMALLLLGLVVLYYADLIGYLSLLERELERVDPT